MRVIFELRRMSVAATLILAAAMAMPALPAAASLQKLVYQVQHPRYGDIGTLTNAIDKNGEQTTVTSEGKFRVSILGIALYRQDFTRVEQWAGERLMSFHGVTNVNGRMTEVSGAAEGDHFVVNSPNGTESAPATVRIANPWSMATLKGDTMMTPDRGLLETVYANAGEMTSIPIKGKMVKARHYEINRPSGERRYDVWFDDQGMPVKFSVNGRNGLVTFTLVS